MVQVHLAPREVRRTAVRRPRPPVRAGLSVITAAAQASPRPHSARSAAELPACWGMHHDPFGVGSKLPTGRLRSPSRWRFRTVKKLLVLAVLGVGGFAVWRKVQADRAELDLWTEATTGDDN